MSEARLTVTSACTQPLNCVVPLKVGSTFLRNLIWVLDHGTPFNPDSHTFADRGLMRAELARSRDLTRAELAQEVSFCVLRDPIERFFSLYFDKAIGPEATRLSWIAETLKANRTFHDAPELSSGQHRENCLSLTQFISVRLGRATKGPINPHWNTQIKRVVSAQDILTPDLYAHIAALYPADIELYDLVKTGWELHGHPPEIEL